MSNTAVALPIHDMNDLVQIGTMMSKTQLFGTNNPSEAAMLAVMCHQSGMTFTQWMETYHFIKGRVSMRADAMLAAFRRNGGQYKIEKRDADGSIAVFSCKGAEYRSRCVWDEIKGEPFAASQNYATPRKRMQMMWARCVSDGVRTVSPESVAGYYTPEEVETFDQPQVQVERVSVEEPAAPATPAPRKPRKAKALPEPKTEVVIDEPPLEDAVPVDAADAGDAMPAAEAAPDFSVCPLEGKAFGKPWADMPSKHLQKALTLDMPDGYKEFVSQVLATRTDEEA